MYTEIFMGEVYGVWNLLQSSLRGFGVGVDGGWNKIGYNLVIVEGDIVFMAVHCTVMSTVVYAWKFW